MDKKSRLVLYLFIAAVVLISVLGFVAAYFASKG